MTSIRLALPAEAAILSLLAEQSKAYWGYDKQLMNTWRTEGAFEIDPDDCAAGLVGVAENDHSIIGFYRICGQVPDGELSDLWVVPNAIGTGEGKKLLNAAVDNARQIGYTTLIIHSDPNAKSFYEKMGAQVIGETLPSSSTGRVLPVLSLTIS